MANDDTVVFGYYLLGFLDILGQSTGLRELRRLPRTEEEAARVLKMLKGTAGTVRSIRQLFQQHFESANAPTELALALPSPARERVIAATQANLVQWGVSDSVIVAASLFDTGHPCTPVNGIYRAFLAAAGTWLLTLSVGQPIRGGLEVGLAVRIEDEEVYGPVLDEAYRLESRVADSPRVVVGDTCLSHLQWYAENPPASLEEAIAAHIASICRSMIRLDTDGVPTLDALGDHMIGLSNTMHEMSEDEAIADRVDPAHEYVRSQLKEAEALGDPTSIRRYRRLLAYFNDRAPTWSSQARRR